MKKVKKTLITGEFHSNLMLITTAVSMIAAITLMIIYIGTKNPTLVNMATSTARIGGSAAFIAVAILAYESVKSKTRFLLEYIVYLLIVGVCLMFMFNLPIWAVGIIYNKLGITNWAKIMLKFLFGLTTVYFVGSIAIHAVLSKQK